MIERARSYQGLFVAPLCIALALACRTALPRLEQSPARYAASSGIVTGTVTAHVNVIRVGGRRVTAINLSNGDRTTAITSGSGAYTLQLAPGRYQLEIAHSPAEVVSPARREITVGAADIEDGVDIRIAPAAHTNPTRIYQPPLPARPPIV